MMSSYILCCVKQQYMPRHDAKDDAKDHSALFHRSGCSAQVQQDLPYLDSSSPLTACDNRDSKSRWQSSSVHRIKFAKLVDRVSSLRNGVKAMVVGFDGPEPGFVDYTVCLESIVELNETVHSLRNGVEAILRRLVGPEPRCPQHLLEWSQNGRKRHDGQSQGRPYISAR